jgi:hypothetical protein
MSKEMDDPQDLHDVMAEETSRGTRHQVKAITRKRARDIKRLADMLGKRYCDERAFVAAIREYGLQEGEERYLRLWELWRQRHGKI